MQAALASTAVTGRDIVNYGEIAKRAVGAGIITLVLSCLLVGIEAVSTNFGLEINTRYRAVFCASVGVAVVYFLSQLMHAGRAMPAVVGGLLILVAFGVLEWAYLQGSPLGDLLPFEAQVVNWAAAIVPLSLVLRGSYIIWAQKSKTVVPTGSQREARFAVFYLKYNKIIGTVLILFAIALPFMPFANRRLIDVATLVVTYIMLATNVGLSFWIALPIAGAMSASFGLLLGFPVLRLRGDYLAIVTLGF